MQAEQQLGKKNLESKGELKGALGLHKTKQHLHNWGARRKVN